MRILAIDLAPRHSGFALLEDESLLWCDVLDVGPEADGFELHAHRFHDMLNKMHQHFSVGSMLPDKAYIENVPHSLVKPANALRLQGVVRHVLCDEWGVPAEAIMPSQWQRWYGWQKTIGMTSKGWAKYAFQALGYEFDKSTMTAKAQTDVRDAVLIARYGYEMSKK